MLVGTSSMDITPEPGCELSGYVAREQPSLGVHSPLYARALYMKTEDTAVVWFQLDLIGMETDDVELLQRRISEIDPIPSVVVSCTHTHSGPSTQNLNSCGAYDRNYVERLLTYLPELAQKAKKNVAEVTLWYAEGHCSLTRNRRSSDPHKQADDQMGIIGFRQKEGKWTAILVHYPIHNVAFSSDNRFISGDLFGRAATYIHETIDGAPTVLFVNGACGDLNPPTHTTDADQVNLWGDELAETAICALQSAQAIPESLKISSYDYHLPLDIEDTESIHKWADSLEKSVVNQDGYVADRVRDAASKWRVHMVQENKAGFIHDYIVMPVQLLHIGGVVFVCMAAEVFAEMADTLRDIFPVPVYVVGYTNGDIGYLAPATAYDEGGYETESAFIFYNSFRPKRGAFEQVRDFIREEIKKISTK